MSFFYPNELQTVKQKLELKYPLNEIKQRHIEKNFYGTANSNITNNDNNKPEGELITTSKTYYQINLTNTKHNLTYEPLLPSHYTARHIYLYGLLHNNIANFSDNNKSIVGELVIEHRPKTAVNQKIFTCYLLEFQDNAPNNLDNLITFIDGEDNDETLKFSLSKIIKNQDQVLYYQSDYDHIFVFMKTIPVNAASKDFLSKLTYKTSLFTTSAPYKSSIISLKDKPSKNVNNPDKLSKTNTGSQETFIGSIFGEKIIETMNDDDDDIYIECDLVNASDETETAVRLGDKPGEENQKKNFLVIMSNFFLFLFLLLFCSWVIPKFYRHAFLIVLFDNVMKLALPADKTSKEDAETFRYNEFYKKLYYTDYRILIITAIFCFFYLSLGTNGNPGYMILFLIFFFGTFFGYYAIRSEKDNNPEFMLFYHKDNGIIKPYNFKYVDEKNVENKYYTEFKNNFKPGPFGWLREFGSYHISLLKNNTGKYATNSFLAISIFIIFFIVYGLIINLIREKSNFGFIFFLNLFYLTPITAAIIKSTMSEQEKLSMDYLNMNQKTDNK